MGSPEITAIVVRHARGCSRITTRTHTLQYLEQFTGRLPQVKVGIVVLGDGEAGAPPGAAPVAPRRLAAGEDPGPVLQDGGGLLAVDGHGEELLALRVVEEEPGGHVAFTLRERVQGHAVTGYYSSTSRSTCLQTLCL